MKKLALAFAAIFVLAMACGGGVTPEAVVQKAIDALENGDGSALVSVLSAEAVEELNGQVEEMKAAPEESAAFMAMMGIEITAEEIESMDAGSFISKMFQSEMLAEELPDFTNVQIGEAVIDGETATVPVTVDGETNDVELVLEDGQWKLGDMMGM
ncbi:hypothetical protein CSA37_04455 [Candidatus Fermentibacteria bacterium]|nr:MAG: hypothetical protein CSA37_04455 [Candidatus Fermentibacteria bacterium]